MAQVNVRIDDAVKADAEALFSRLGMNISTAFNIFIRQSLTCRGLPFEVRDDPFYHPKNIEHLRRVSEDYEAGRNFAEHDLIED